jgi:hypothetical protein
MDLASPTLRSAQDGLGTIDKQECPGWTWQHGQAGMPRTGSKDGLQGWTTRIDSQDGLSGWTWQHEQSTMSGYDNSGHIRGPTPGIN